MFGSSPGGPYWAQATASSPSKTRAACARSSLTSYPFERVAAFRSEPLLGVEGAEPCAPTPTEHTVVPLDEKGERVPSIHTERFDHAVIHRPFSSALPGSRLTRTSRRLGVSSDRRTLRRHSGTLAQPTVFGAATCV